MISTVETEEPEAPAAIAVAVVVYAVLILLTRAISKDDLALMPKGERIARLLRVK